MASVKLVSIQLENFKSFQHLMFDDLQTASLIALIGLNGTGKSNLVDGFLYVLGETNAQILRAKKMSNLIHPQASICTVTLIVQKDYNQFILQRTTNTEGKSSYRINGQIVTFSEYLEELHDMGMDYLVKNYFVQQGCIREVADMSIKQLGEFLEKMSHSIEFKPEYDRLFKAHQEVACKAQAQRGIKDRLKQRKSSLQKQLAALLKSIELGQQCDTQKLHLAVFDACQMNFDMEDNIAKKRMLTKEVNAQSAEVAKLTTETTLLKQKVQTTNDVIRATDEKIAAHNKEIEKFDIICIERNVELESCQTRIKSVQKTMHDLKLKREANLVTTKQYEADAHTLAEKLQAVEAEYETLPSIDATPGQILEYSVLKSQLEQRLATDPAEEDSDAEHFSQRMETVRRCMDRVREEYDAVKKLDTVCNQLIHSGLDKKKAELESSKSEYSNKVQELQMKHQAELNLLKETQEALDANVKERNELMKDICILNGYEHEADVHNEFIKTLMSRVPGVIGQLEDLITVKQQYRHYWNAVKVGLMQYFKCVVVENKRVVQKCELYMQNHSNITLRFLPLDDLKVDEPNTMLANVKDAVLLFDILEFDVAYRVAVLYACKNVVLVPNDEMAQMLSRNMGIHISVISQSGLYYKNDGSICLHNTKTLPKVNKHQLKKKKERLQVVNEAIILKRMQLPDLKLNTVAFNLELDYAKKHLKYLDEEHAKVLQLYKTSNLSQLHEYDAEIEKYKTFLDQGESRENARRLRTERIENEVFADFCSRHNLTNIREFENIAFSAANALLKEQMKDMRIRSDAIAQHIISLQEDEQGEQSLSFHQTELQRLIERQQQLEAKLHETTKKLNESTEKCYKLKEFKKSRVRIIRDSNATINRLKEQSSSITIASLTTSYKLKKIDEKIDLCAREFSLFLDECKRKNIVLPRLEVASLSSTDDASILGKIDFSILPHTQKVRQNSAARAATRQEYESQIKFLDAELDNLGAPNLSANEELQEAKKEYETARQLYNRLIVDMNRAKVEVERVEKLRCERLNNCCKKVNESVDRVYKELMKSTNARAQILAIDENCPFSGGISYMCAIPGKSFSCVKDLSSGEKSLSALALYFALREYHPAPLLLLDEVDCSLDVKYLNNLGDYLEAHRQEGLQTVLVTHKPTTASKADDLAAITTEDNEDPQKQQAIVKYSLREIGE